MRNDVGGSWPLVLAVIGYLIVAAVILLGLAYTAGCSEVIDAAL